MGIAAAYSRGDPVEPVSYPRDGRCGRFIARGGEQFALCASRAGWDAASWLTGSCKLCRTDWHAWFGDSLLWFADAALVCLGVFFSAVAHSFLFRLIRSSCGGCRHTRRWFRHGFMQGLCLCYLTQVGWSRNAGST